MSHQTQTEYFDPILGPLLSQNHLSYSDKAAEQLKSKVIDEMIEEIPSSEEESSDGWLRKNGCFCCSI